MRKQFGGTALFSLGKAAHRAIGKGADPSKLGRWAWTLYRGKNQHLLKVYVAYRPNPPSGPFSVYAQQHLYFTSQGIDKCPREAFLSDLATDIHQSMENGTHILLLLDGNEDMRGSAISRCFSNLHLHEALFTRHGTNAPSTYKRNSRDIPIDGIWASPGLTINIGGYFPFDKVFLGTDHRCLWADLSFSSAFGYTMPPTVKPSARHLNCQDPRLVNNFNCCLYAFYVKHQLLECIKTLLSITTYPASASVKTTYEELDAICMAGVKEAE
jgi:hypothetical protein